jgi:hypothetical protein
MKKILFSALLMMSFLPLVMAQNNTTAKKFSWGYKIGLNASNIRLEDAADTDWKTGLVTGLFFTIKTGEKLSLQPELLYSSMGGRNALESNSSLRLNYFSIPLLAKYQVCKKWNVIAGPQIDMMIQAKEKNSSNQFTKLTKDFKESSFNVTAGAEFSPLHCTAFALRYIYGFTNIAEFSTMKMKNQAIQLTAAIKF